MLPARAGLCAHTRKKTIKILAHSIPQDGRPIYQHKKKQRPVSIPKIKPWQKQPKIIQKQIWKFSGPL